MDLNGLDIVGGEKKKLYLFLVVRGKLADHDSVGVICFSKASNTANVFVFSLIADCFMHMVQYAAEFAEGKLKINAVLH